MKLRNFLYLNTKVLEDYVAAIDGYIYDEESQEIATSSENTLGGRGTVRTLESDPKKSKDLCILVTPQSLKKSINIFDRMTKD